VSSAVDSAEAGEYFAARDDDRHTRSGRQQRAHLFRADRVVQNDQHALAGQLAAVHGGGLGFVRRDPVGRDAEAEQEPDQRVQRSQRALRAVPAQVHVELTVREAA
jgi:hypothetical protein